MPLMAIREIMYFLNILIKVSMADLFFLYTDPALICKWHFSFGGEGSFFEKKLYSREGVHYIQQLSDFLISVSGHNQKR